MASTKRATAPGGSGAGTKGTKKSDETPVKKVEEKKAKTAKAPAGKKVLRDATGDDELALASNDPRNDDPSPDAPADVVALHAERLAETVRGRAVALAKAKVSKTDATQLDALAGKLRASETAWRSHWTSEGGSNVAEAREQATVGRKDLFSGLRTFAEDDADTQSELDDIASIESDADLLQDLDRLAALAKKHAKDLAGTDVDAKRVAQIAKSAERFRVARAGAAEEGEAGDSAARENAAARSAKGQRLLRARNGAFWALSRLDRRVCARGRHLYRHDPKALGEFAAYATRGRARAGAEEGGGGGGGGGGGEKKPEADKTGEGTKKTK